MENQVLGVRKIRFSISDNAFKQLLDQIRNTMESWGFKYVDTVKDFIPVKKWCGSMPMAYHVVISMIFEKDVRPVEIILRGTSDDRREYVMFTGFDINDPEFVLSPKLFHELLGIIKGFFSSR